MRAPDGPERPGPRVRPMRILIAVHSYPPGSVGGAEQRAERTARALHARGHQVRVLSVHRRRGASGPGVADETYRQIAVRRLWLTDEHEPAFAESYDNAQVAATLRRLLDEWRPDLVHQFSGYLSSSAVVATSRALGIPVVVSLTDYWWLCHRVTLVRTLGEACGGASPPACALCRAQRRRRLRWPGRVAPRLLARAWRAADATRLTARVAGLEEQRRRSTLLGARLADAQLLLAPSEYVAAAYRRHGVDAARLRVMRQGVEGAQRLERTGTGGLRVGYLGQIKRHKGVDLLVDAWAGLRDSQAHRLTLVGSSAGEDAYRQQLQQRTAGWPAVSWQGALARDEIWSALSRLDIVVVPSRWAENSPNIILEAQAVGVPVVGARIGGIPELVAHRVNGLLFEPDDAADLAAQLHALIDEPGLLGSLRQAARPVRTVQDEVAELIRAYETLTAGSTR